MRAFGVSERGQMMTRFDEYYEDWEVERYNRDDFAGMFDWSVAGVYHLDYMPSGEFTLQKGPHTLNAAEAQRVIDGILAFYDRVPDEVIKEIQHREWKSREASFKERREADDREPEVDRSGYVYVLKGVNGFYKIGRTSNPSRRIEHLEVMLPFPIEAEMIIRTDDMYQLEAEFHQCYRGLRGKGEWFALNDRIIEAIRRDYADDLIED
jgi:hypothetical protein